MKTVNRFAMCALLAPALTVGAGSAYAQATTQSSSERQAQEQRTTQDRAKQDRSAQGTEFPGATHSSQRQEGAHQHGATRPGSATAQRPGASMGQQNDRSEQLSKAPENAFHADSLLDQEMRSQTGDESLGTVNDIVIGEDGQVLAVVVGVGGMLGMGERDVAIAWDSLQHSRNSEGDSEFTTSMTQDSLRDAPDYNREDTASKPRTERSNQGTEPLGSN